MLAIVPALTQHVAPFLAILGLSYFFIQFGPNMTTFVLPSEVFPVSMRTTGHGIAAGIGKLGAFVGVFLVPVLQDHIGLRGLLAVAGASAVLGFAVTTCSRSQQVGRWKKFRALLPSMAQMLGKLHAWVPMQTPKHLS